MGRNFHHCGTGARSRLVRGCNLTSHQLAGDLTCTVDQYCDFFNKNYPETYECREDPATADKVEVTRIKDECCGIGEGWLNPSFDICYTNRYTETYEGASKSLTTNFTLNYTKGLNLSTAVESTLRSEDNPEILSDCEVYLGDQKCQSCSVCNNGEPFGDAPDTWYFDEDCSNLHPSLKYFCIDRETTSYVAFLAKTRICFNSTRKKLQPLLGEAPAQQAPYKKVAVQIPPWELCLEVRRPLSWWWPLFWPFCS